MSEKIKLVKVGAPWCSPCITMAKKQTLEKFAAKHPEVEIVKYDLPGSPECPVCEEDGEPGEACEQDGCTGKIPALSEAEQKATDWADEHEVDTIPTVIIFRGDDELGRSEEAVSLKELEALYKEAIE